MSVFSGSRCCWSPVLDLVLVLGSWGALVSGAHSGMQQALCVSCFQDKKDVFSTLTCSLKCRRGLDSQRLQMCQDIQSGEDTSISLDADPYQQEQEAAGAMTPPDDKVATRPEHQLLKKYGGFMKRYGGFMSRRSSPQGALDGLRDLDGEENIRLGILRIISAAQHDSKEECRGEERVKRYEGLNQEDTAPGNLLEGVLSRGLKKRYGGFMRRVGRPEWLVSNSKDGGELKRACENGNGLQKRYGGFMD